MFSDREGRARLTLFRSANIGPITFRRVIEQFGSAEKALVELPCLMARRGGAGKVWQPEPADVIDREYAAVKSLNAKHVFWGAPDYPRLLAEADDAPPVLIIKGNPALFERPAVAVVGARNASLNGRRFTQTLVAGLADAGYIVVSGVARGIDTAAHQASLVSGTVGVVAGGIDVIYPPENAELMTAIGRQGLLVAENPPGTEPQARHFPRRNRIISGLCLGVVVVEAAEKSGSLITARFALEQNREVFAVPGSPLDPRAGGCNRLIKEGAHVVLTPDDVIQVLQGLRLRPLREESLPPPQPPPVPVDDTVLDQVRLRLSELLSLSPVDINDVIREIGLPPSVVLSVILELELAGKVERTAGNKINLI